MTFGGLDGARLLRVLADVARERRRQDQLHPFVDMPDGTGTAMANTFAQIAKQVCEEKASVQSATWADVLVEEVLETLAESDPRRLREELIQVAAVAVKWCQWLDNRGR